VTYPLKMKFLMSGLYFMAMAIVVPPTGIILWFVSHGLLGLVWVSDLPDVLPLLGILAVILGVQGQILCLLGPLSSSTRIKLVAAVLIMLLSLLMDGPLSLLMMVRGSVLTMLLRWFDDGLIHVLVGLAAVGAYVAYLYGMCDDLESQPGRQSLNRAALTFLLALFSAIAMLALESEFVPTGETWEMVGGVLVGGLFCLACAQLSWSYFVLARSVSALSRAVKEVQEPGGQG